MDMEFVKQIEKSIKNRNLKSKDRHAGEVLEQVRSEKVALTLLLELVSEKICGIMDKEEAVLNDVFKEMEGIDHRLEGDFVFERQRSGPKIVYKEPLKHLGNVINPKNADFFPLEFIEKKEVFILLRKEFEKSLAHGDTSGGACWVNGKERVGVFNRKGAGQLKKKQNPSSYTKISNLDIH